MDTELSVTLGQLKLASQALSQRQKRLEGTTTKLSTHYSKLKHTATLLAMIAEVYAVLHEDPDLWDTDPYEPPF